MGGLVGEWHAIDNDIAIVPPTFCINCGNYVYKKVLLCRTYSYIIVKKCTFWRHDSLCFPDLSRIRDVRLGR